MKTKTSKMSCPIHENAISVDGRYMISEVVLLEMN